MTVIVSNHPSDDKFRGLNLKTTHVTSQYGTAGTTFVIAYDHFCEPSGASERVVNPI
jgi:hypothetical protein